MCSDKPKKWKCQVCGQVFDKEVVAHYPPRGFKNKWPKLGSSMTCVGSVKEEK